MLKMILFILNTLLAVLLLFGSIGEKDYRNKKLCAALAVALFILALVCAVI